MGHLSLTLTGINIKGFLIYKNASLIIRLAFFYADKRFVFFREPSFTVIMGVHGTDF
ncbi:MAG: hypothetical protein ACI9IP_002590 [Arcticibacterium sp.]|jgi:hypothetical protein